MADMVQGELFAVETAGPPLVMNPGATGRFDRLLKLVGARGRGLTLPEIATAAALARELEAGAPDRPRLEALAARLELDPSEVVKAAGPVRRRSPRVGAPAPAPARLELWEPEAAAHTRPQAPGGGRFSRFILWLPELS